MKKNDFRKNIKLTEPIFNKLKALMKVKDVKQYELIEILLDFYVTNKLSEKEREFFNYQLDELRKEEHKDE
ncbi:hypothetical protein NSS76_19340 [Bacillus sp. FSL R5-0654]|uniref:hypothetical protein n=1 Tax=Bacillus TaxID=1386 RepID=UPI0013EE761D|nr:hypothetical protein [Bacillus altitudinis]QII27018.1 hypothetical protein G3M80_21200 [Bacillus altitudinis]